jgi:hypothetical protein
MNEVEEIDDQKLAVLLNASFDETIAPLEQIVLQMACQRPENSESVIRWLRFETAMRLLAPAPTSVADSLTLALAKRKPPRPGFARTKARWVGATLLVVAGVAAAAHHVLRDVPKSESMRSFPPEIGRPADQIPNPLPVFVADEDGVPSATSASEAAESTDISDHPDVRWLLSAGDTIVRSYDFESGVLPLGFSGGRIVEPGVPRADSRYAAQGTQGKYAPGIASVVFSLDWLVAYDDAIVIRFRYFLEAPGARLRLQIYNHDQRQNYQFDLPGVQYGRWAEAEVPIRKMWPVRDTVRHMEPGDRLTVVYLMGGSADETGIMVDDLTVLRRPPRTDPDAPATTKHEVP